MIYLDLSYCGIVLCIFLIDERENAFEWPFVKFVAKFGLIFFVDAVGAWHKVGACPNDEHQSRQTPCEYGKACPFDYFAEIVGRCYIFVHAFFGQIVFGVARRAQVANDVVAVQVDVHADKKQQHTDDKLRRGNPCGGVHVVRRDEENPFALQIAVQCVENHAHQHDGNRHFAFTFQQEGENERALEIVQFEE